MKIITVYSRNRIYKTFEQWSVPLEFASHMYNYLVYGLPPGSFFTAIIANDFGQAVLSSHPANTIKALKSLSLWMRDKMPEESYGSYHAVEQWCNLNTDDRHGVLEKHGLIYSEKEEVLMALKGEPTVETTLHY